MTDRLSPIRLGRRAAVSVLRSLRLLRPRAVIDDDEHPERLAVLEHVRGDRVLEVGCGPRKTSSSYIGLDLVPKGRLGTTGNAKGRPSQADVCGWGNALPFATASFDCVVARHNLEHYIDLVDVLDEWARVLSPAGRLVVVVPDEDRYPGRTVELDPTHHHSFNDRSLARLLERLGWRLRTSGPCVDGWSILVAAERVE